ncbi:MAG: protein translocase subunit SecF [Tetrasphaera sp.]
MSKFAQFGNDLYTGKRSIDFIGRSRTWYAISAVGLILALLGLGVRHLNLGIEFTGGSEFRVSNTTVTDDYERRAEDAVAAVAPDTTAKVSRLGSETVRVQTEKLDDAASAQVRTSLARAFDAPQANVSASFIGPSWGESVSKQALRALIVFLILVALVMAVYFRTWKMAVAALAALIHDLIFTVGIYALTGVEVSPATMIGFLTVLGYSLYDTVVVFDKIRENTDAAFANHRMSYAAAANLAVNQTLVRSINTTVVAVLPIIAVLVLAFTRLGPGTLMDLSLALFIGMTVGAYSSIFIAPPVLVHLRAREEEVVKLAKQAERHESRVAASAAKREAAPVAAGAVAPAGGSRAGNSRAGATRAGATVAGAGAAASVRSGPQDAPDHTPVDTPIHDAADHAAGDHVDGAADTLTGRKVHKYAQQGPRNQPRRVPKSKR